jgi:hypothetical protein
MTLINTQLDAHILLYRFISILYMFRATLCSLSGEPIVSIQHLVYITLCRRPSGMQVGKFLPDGHLHRVTSTRCCIDTIGSPDDEHKVAWNMYRIYINIYKRNCASSWRFIRINPSVYFWGKSHGTHWVRGWLGPRAGCDKFWEEINFLCLSGFKLEWKMLQSKAIEKNGPNVWSPIFVFHKSCSLI